MRRRLLLTTVATLAVGAACMDTIIKLYGPENHVALVVLPDSCRFQAESLDNVHDVTRWTWTNTGTAALVFHRSFLHHGGSQLTILDAQGDSVYRRVPLEYTLDDTTDTGVPGVWTIELQLFGARGRVDISAVKVP